MVLILASFLPLVTQVESPKNVVKEDKEVSCFQIKKHAGVRLPSQSTQRFILPMDIFVSPLLQQKPQEPKKRAPLPILSCTWSRILGII